MPDSQKTPLFIWISRFLCISVVLIGVMTLIGWATRSIELTGLKETFVPMAPNTALIFIILGITCVFLTSNFKWKKGTGYCTVIFSLTVAILELIDILTNESLHIANWFFSFDVFYDYQFMFPIAKMSFPTAIAFFAICAALLINIINHRIALSNLFSAGFSGAGLIIGLMFLLGYAYENPLLYGGPTIPMAANTAFSLVLLSLAILIFAIGIEFIEQKRVREETDLAKTTFLSVISHELRTPLTPIRIYLELMLKNKLNEKKKVEMTGTVLKNFIRLNSLINDLLDATRIQANRLIIHPKTEVLSAIIEHSVKTVEPFAKENKIVLKKDLQTLPKLNIDKDRMQQVLINLITNAIKHSGAREIIISASSNETDVFVCVKDKGVGISKENIEKLFKPFTVTKKEAATKGVGLGLFICKAIVEAHKGKIWVESKEGEGSSFCFRIPLR